RPEPPKAAVRPRHEEVQRQLREQLNREQASLAIDRERQNMRDQLARGLGGGAFFSTISGLGTTGSGFATTGSGTGSGLGAGAGSTCAGGGGGSQSSTAIDSGGRFCQLTPNIRIASSSRCTSAASM